MGLLTTRRHFLAEVGRGTLVATLGASTALDLGLASRADAVPREDDRLLFGDFEPLVQKLEETPAERVLTILVGELDRGVELKTLVKAAALANARSFGGTDYVGFHTMMALAPALHMAEQMPAGKRALPVFKVLHRNARRLQESGRTHAGAETMRKVAALESIASDRAIGALIREYVRAGDLRGAEAVFAAVEECCPDPEGALEAVLWSVQDHPEVHRVVLPYRAWELSRLIGQEHAQTLLRQSIHYCVANEEQASKSRNAQPRELLPRLLEEHRLADARLGGRGADDRWVDDFSRTLFEAAPDVAAEAAAAALREGFEPDAIGEAIVLAANQLVLRDAGRRPAEARPGKPAGSVHGDSIGVHACDSANAWRRLARVGSSRNRAACLILGAYQVALDRTNRGGDFANWQPRPHAETLAAVTETRPEAVLAELDTAIRANDQERACALAARYAESGAPSRDAFQVLLRYSVSEDGALHAEKYYQTVSEEFAESRPAFRARQLVGLARVTASAFGTPAPGMDEAARLIQP